MELKSDIHDTHSGINIIYEAFDEGEINKEQATERMWNICSKFVDDNRVERREKKR